MPFRCAAHLSVLTGSGLAKGEARRWEEEGSLGAKTRGLFRARSPVACRTELTGTAPPRPPASHRHPSPTLNARRRRVRLNQMLGPECIRARGVFLGAICPDPY